MNGLQSLQTWKTYFHNPAGALLGFINAAQSLGSVFALPLVGWFSDKYGRKPILLAGILMIIIATVIQSASINIEMFIVSRFVVGFGGMFVVQPSPMLIAELAYPTHRGKYTSAFWTMYYLGKFFSSPFPISPPPPFPSLLLKKLTKTPKKAQSSPPGPHSAPKTSPAPGPGVFPPSCKPASPSSNSSSGTGSPSRHGG